MGRNSPRSHGAHGEKLKPGHYPVLYHFSTSKSDLLESEQHNLFCHKEFISYLFGEVS